ncbi:trihelix transcription factor GTL1-like, partial [Cajanus cajan]|uniref:trihelix transcription factor GTL1-like n=1 Tax=Cajanus cajan TaxID=3821 RepID=UPI0010FB4685
FVLPCFSSSLDAADEDEDDDNSSASSEALGSRKRRRKTERKLEGFVKNLVTKVMEKQELMHRQLVEMIENKERERIKREEAWKHEEMERIRKDEEARAQERSRNLALISFIQNLLGHEIQIPQPVEEACGKREEDEVEVNAQKDLNNDSSNNRWPDVEVQSLITVRTSLEHKVRLMGSKGSIWEEISEAMHGMGYNRSAKKCKEKWENINKYYKRTVGSGKKRRLNSKTICGGGSSKERGRSAVKGGMPSSLKRRNCSTPVSSGKSGTLHGWET